MGDGAYRFRHKHRATSLELRWEAFSLHPKMTVAQRTNRS